MIFYSFKNVKIVQVNLKAHSSSLYEDGRKSNHVAFWEHFLVTLTKLRTTLVIA